MKTPAHPPPHSQAIEKPSIWGIFALPEIDEILDDRIVLIGDAACVPVYASISHTETLLQTRDDSSPRLRRRPGRRSTFSSLPSLHPR